MANDFDDEFAEEARRAEAEEKAKAEERKNRKANFTEIKWVGFTSAPQMKILRFLGKHPDLHFGTSIPASSETDARVINLSRIVADNGKQMDMVLPLYDRNSNHIIWRIIDRVNAVEWKKEKNKEGKDINVKVFPNEKRHPDIFNLINYNNLLPDNVQRKFGLIGRGWRGREILIANVIDREEAEWHSANRHSALLSKKITYKKQPDGTTTIFVEKGVPSFGLNSLLNTIRKTYGDWEKYDIGYTRTGTKDNPNDVFNATRTPERASESLLPLISDKALSSEEKSYELYNLNKLFAVSTYTKLWNRLHLTIEKIDAVFGTTYAEELKKLVDTEKVDREESLDTETETEVEEPDVIVEEAKEPIVEVTSEAPVSRKIIKTESSLEDLPGWDTLRTIEKNLIISAEPIPGKKAWKIVYDPSVGKSMGECPDCETRSPPIFQHCPGCGVSFGS